MILGNLLKISCAYTMSLKILVYYNLSLSFIIVPIICPHQSKHGNKVKRGKKQVVRHQRGWTNVSCSARLSNTDTLFGVKAKSECSQNHTLYRNKLWIHATIDQSVTIKVGLLWVFTMGSLGNSFIVNNCFPIFQSSALKTDGWPFCCRLPISH